MGEFLFSSISGQPAGMGVHQAVGRSVLSLVIAFSFQLLYIGGSGCKKILHPIRKVRHNHAYASPIILIPDMILIVICSCCGLVQPAYPPGHGAHNRR